MAGLGLRTLQLLSVGLSERPLLAVSHGSRAQLLAAAILRIPSISIDDYEYSREVADPTWMIMPEVIPEGSVKAAKDRVFRYPGIKEDVYVPFFQPDPEVRELLGIDGTEVVVTIRPPATEAHYHDALSEKLFEASIEFICAKEGTRVIILPRGSRQRASIEEKWGRWFREQRILIPEKAVDGLSLIWYSDLVISGGGTMNREAAALGVPVYSIFTGTIGAVDRYLCSTGRLALLRTVGDVQSRILLTRRQRLNIPNATESTALERIVEIVDRIAQGRASFE